MMRRLPRVLIMSVLLVIGVMVGSYFTSKTVGADTTIPIEDPSIQATGDVKTSVTDSQALTSDETNNSISENVSIPEVTTKVIDENPDIDPTEPTESTSNVTNEIDQQTDAVAKTSITQPDDNSDSETVSRSGETRTETIMTKATDEKTTVVSEKADATELKPVKIVQSNGNKVEIAPVETKAQIQNTAKKKIVSITQYDSKVLPKTNETNIKGLVTLFGISGLLLCCMIVSIYRKHV